MGKLEEEIEGGAGEGRWTITQAASDTSTSLTSVLGPQSQHEAQREGLGPGHLCPVHQQAK